MSTGKLYIPIIVLSGSLILLFIIAPLAGLFINTSFTELFDTAKDNAVNNSIVLTLITSFIGTFIFALPAIPFSWFLARKKFYGRQLLLGIINLPIVIPHTAAGIALLGFISRDSALGQIAESMGISFVGSPLAISFAMAFVSIPFLIHASVDAFSAVPERLEKVALSLGKSPFYVFFRISLPLAWRGIFTGLTLMFARGLSEFGAVVIVAYHPMTTPVLIFERFQSFGLTYARPAAVLFIIVCLIFFIAFRYLSKIKNHATN